jgi:hypothetical protein
MYLLVRKLFKKQTKYLLSLVSIPTLLKQQIVNKTPIGVNVQPYLARQTLGEEIYK